MKVKVGPPGPAQRWHRGLAEENLCHNKFNLYEAEDEFERGESECHVLPGLVALYQPRKFSKGVGHCIKDQKVIFLSSTCIRIRIRILVVGEFE